MVSSINILSKHKECLFPQNSISYLTHLVRVKDMTVSGRATGLVTLKGVFFSLGMHPLLSNNLIDPCL